MNIKTPLRIEGGVIVNSEGRWLTDNESAAIVHATNHHHKLMDMIQEMLTAQTIGTERERDRARRLAVDALAEARG